MKIRDLFHSPAPLTPKEFTVATKKPITLDRTAKQPFCNVGSSKVYAVQLSQALKLINIPGGIEAIQPLLAAEAIKAGWTVKDAVLEIQRLFGTIEKKTQGSAKLSPETISHNRDVRDLARILADLEPNTSPEGLLARLNDMVAEVGPEAIKYLADKPRREGWLLLRNK